MRETNQREILELSLGDRWFHIVADPLPDEISRRTDFDFYPRELAEKYKADDKRIMESGKTEELEEKYIQERQERWVNTVKVPVKDEYDNLTGVLGIFWDITDRKRAEEALRQTEEQLHP